MPLAKFRLLDICVYLKVGHRLAGLLVHILMWSERGEGGDNPRMHTITGNEPVLSPGQSRDTCDIWNHWSDNTTAIHQKGKPRQVSAV